MDIDFAGKKIVITGGASGIGAGIAEMAVRSGARVAIIDLNPVMANDVAMRLGCSGYGCDVTVEADLKKVIDQIQSADGEIDIFVSNAGIFEAHSGHAAAAPDEIWARNWAVHVMAHVYAARILLPGMIARGHGYFVNVTSAAGLLNQIGDAPYSASKHAAVSFAESLAITHAKDGIGVSVVCPQYVATPLIGLSDDDAKNGENLMSAAEVAHEILTAVREERFLVLPHPQVQGYAQLRATDHDAWIKGMQKLRSKALDALGEDDIQALYRLI